MAQLGGEFGTFTFFFLNDSIKDLRQVGYCAAAPAAIRTRSTRGTRLSARACVADVPVCLGALLCVVGSDGVVFSVLCVVWRPATLGVT